jgi:hypothetical protein
MKTLESCSKAIANSRLAGALSIERCLSFPRAGPPALLPAHSTQIYRPAV